MSVLEKTKWCKTIVLSLFGQSLGDFRLMRDDVSDLSDRFARVVEVYRKKKGYSKAELAQRAGLHQTYVGLLEKGRRSPNLDTANAVAKALGKRLSKLIAEAEKFNHKRR